MNGHLFITGAANGLGKATAALFAGKGWQVTATDIDATGLDKLASVPGIRTLLMDVTSDESVGKVLSALRDQGTTLDLIINNAGIDRYFPFSEAPVSSFREVFELNVFGPYRVNQSLLPLLKRPGGRIIHIGSESLRLQVPFMPYPLSKQLLEGYSKSLRQELRFLGIDVVLIRSGPIRTALLENVSSIRYPVSDPVLRKAFDHFTGQAAGEIGKISPPEKVARLIFKVAARNHPTAVYRINNCLKLRIAGMIPFGLVEKEIYRRLKG